MPKYKPGDKVVVSKDIRDDDDLYFMEGHEDDGMYVCGDMEDYRGKVVTITEADTDGYYIEEDDGEYCWTDEMFSVLQIL